MRTITKTVGIAIAAALLFGCNGGGENGSPGGTIQLDDPVAAEIVPGEEQALFPLAEGNKWVYRVEQTTVQANRGANTSEATVEFRVASATPSGNGTEAMIEIYSDGTLINKVEWRVDDTGIYQVASTRIDNSGTAPVEERRVFQPAQIVVKFPIEDGEEFPYSGTGPVPLGGPTSMTATNETRGKEIVDTLLGDAENFVQMEAVAVISETEYTEVSQNQPVRAVSTSWWAPGVGMVRLKQTTVSQQLGVSIEQVFRLESYDVR